MYVLRKRTLSTLFLWDWDVILKMKLMALFRNNEINLF